MTLVLAALVDIAPWPTRTNMGIRDPEILSIAAHGLLSVPAALAFFAKSRWAPPGSAIRASPAIDASLVPGIVRNYAFVLLSIAALCATLSTSLASGPQWPIVESTFDIWRRKLIRRIRWSLAIYHIGPILRASERIWQSIYRSAATQKLNGAGTSPPSTPPAGSDLGGPWVHLLTHTAVLAGLLWKNAPK